MNAWIRDNIKIIDLICHRRWGKDDCSLHGLATKAHQRIANYCYMLPMEKGVREAIWEAINPHTGINRLEESFPMCIREKTNEQQMRITLLNGSKVVFAGSDNFRSKIGSSLAGLVYSEWSLSDPASYGYLAPMLKENGGWCVRQGTARGENHAYKTLMSGMKDPNRFAQLVTVEDSGMNKILDMEEIKQEYIDIFGEDLGLAMYLQEWWCSFKAPIAGSVYGKELTKLENEGRIKSVPHVKGFKVFTAWDIGRTDSTAVWFYQVINNEVRVIDYEEKALETPDYFFSRILGIKITVNIIDAEIQVVRGGDLAGFEHRKEYDYETHNLPHDAKAKTFAATGKSLQDQAHAVFTWTKVDITPSLSIQDGIKSARQLLRTIVIDHKAQEGFDALKEYVYKYDEKNKVLSVKPLHNWASNAADAFRYMAIAYETPRKEQPKPRKPNPNDTGIVMADYIKPRAKPQW